MKTNIKYIIYFICYVSLLSVSACSNLKEEVFSDITEDTYKYEPGDANKIVGAIYTNLRGYLGFYAMFAQEICTDESVQPANAAGWDDGGVFRRMHLHSWTSEQTHVGDLWNLHYTGVLLANRVIQRLQDESFPLASTENRQTLIAETRALRAFHYWQIVDNWGNAPLVTEPTNDLPANASKKDIYDFIVSELTDCMGNLPEKKDASNYGRFTIWAAKALLANVYLNAVVYSGTAQWEECITQCNDILNSGVYQLDANYLDPFKAKNEVSKENIFVIPFDQIYAKGFFYFMATLHSSNQKTYNLEVSPWGPGAFKAVPQFINTYDNDDQRLTDTWLSGPQFGADGSTLVGAYDLINQPLIFLNSMPDGIFTGEADGYRWKKYEIPMGSKENLNNDYVVFRLGQVYMMKAECLLRSGQADAAAEIVTLVRQRAFKNTNPQKATVTGTELQQPSKYVYGTVENYVLTPQGKSYPEQFGRFYDELGWEFAGEMTRRRDMIRFGHYTKAEWLSHKPNGDYRSVFPIPQLVIDANPKLKQNDGYTQ
ncbi:MAG TPA: RagB/SusD family nutrient uptake outer membrane protein [Prolixibacteraceae bacterium]|nr:RagB/SusD family nutrient uptake outer membrane protein [Prolixibacteraceae bacterium]